MGFICAAATIQKQANGIREGKANSIKCVMIPINECLPHVLECGKLFHKPARVVFKKITAYFLLKGNCFTLFQFASSSVSFFNYCYLIMS